MVKIKLCGNQSEADVEATAAADAQGFIVMTPSSSRQIEPEQAAELMSLVPVFNVAVLVTTVTDPLLLSDMVEALEPQAVQVHVELNAIQIGRIRRALGTSVPLYSVLAVSGDVSDCVERAKRLAEAPLAALLLDSKVDDQLGGTGVPHAWETSACIREVVDPLPIILAGGITPENVREAIDTVRPYAVDVASGVETDGCKAPSKIQALLKQVRPYGY